MFFKQHWITETQCGNFEIFLPLRVYVKSIFGDFRSSKNCHFEPQKLDFDDFLESAIITVFEFLESSKLISRKIWMVEKLPNLLSSHVFFEKNSVKSTFTLGWVDFTKYFSSDGKFMLFFTLCDLIWYILTEKKKNCFLFLFSLTWRPDHSVIVILDSFIFIRTHRWGSLDLNHNHHFVHFFGAFLRLFGQKELVYHWRIILRLDARFTSNDYK